MSLRRHGVAALFSMHYNGTILTYGVMVMIYLERFRLPDQDQEDAFLSGIRRTCYPTRYPFHVFRYRRMPELEFEPVTILAGGNGSGKSTLLNVMAETLGLRRTAVYNRSPFFEDYTALCRCRVTGNGIQNGRIITSDDVFDYLLNIRCLNENLDNQREQLLAEYRDLRYSQFQLHSLEDYKELARHVDAARRTGSDYARTRLMESVPEQSNGESALRFFTEAIGENALYLLDEPENSLSAARQLELQTFLADSARFYGCQFVISTHSPFLLAIPGAKIYNLDATPPAVCRWTELENVQVYRTFFRQREKDFIQEDVP